MICSKKSAPKFLVHKAKLFLQGIVTILIKHVLQSIPIYVLETIDPPKQVLVDLERPFPEFLLGSDKRHQISWNNIYHTTEHNGLGIVSLHHRFVTFAGKLWWCFSTKDNLWSKFMRSKYGDPTYILSNPIPLRILDSHINACYVLWGMLNPILVLLFGLETFLFSGRIRPFLESLLLMLQ